MTPTPGQALHVRNSDAQARDAYPLTPLQQGMLFHTLAGGDSGVYVQQLVGDLAEDLDTAAFREAWGWLAARHDALRTRFTWSGASSPRQIVDGEIRVPWDERDWRGLAARQQESEFAGFLAADRQRGFDVAAGPLLRVALFRLRRARYRLVWTSHHGILDGRSRLVLLEELFDAYGALRRGRRPAARPVRPYREFVRRLANRDAGADAAFWTEVLTRHDPPGRLDLPRPVRPPPGLRVRKNRVRLSAALTARLISFAAEEGLTLNTLIQGAWAILLSRYTGRRSVAFGAIRAGRASARAGAERTVGLLINTVPVPVDVDPAAPLGEWLRDLRALWLSMRGHEQTPLVEINACLPPTRRPLELDSLVAFERLELNEALRARGDGWDRRTFTLHGQTNYPLVVYGYGGNRLLVEMEHDPTRVEDRIAGGLLTQLRNLLAEFARRPNRTLSEIPVLTPSERRRLLVEWNDTRTPYPRDRCIHRLFEDQAARTPDAVAVADGDRRVTYRELNARANRVAHRLRGLGVAPNTAVGVCMDRSVEMVVGLLGILKAGAAYLPLDPAYPAERLDLMVRDGRVDVALTVQDVAARLPTSVRHVVIVDAPRTCFSGESADNLPAAATANDLAYVLYTSGSTGRPKGVAVRHRSVTRLLFGVDYAVLDAEQTILHLAPLSFDASTFEIWGALLHGGRLVLAPPGPPDLAGLAELIARHGVTTVWLTAALFNRLVETRPDALTPVRQILTGGEALSVPHVRRALDHLAPGARLVNGYGPTECTTFTCCDEIPRDVPADQPSIPIGRPIGNTEVFVLDEERRLVPVGVPGELYVGGDGLALGYWRNPELTAERFVPHPFSSDPGARLYRTGDRVRWLPDGRLEFLGRQDDQVKLRGYRIELGEIDHALRRHEGVAQGVVALREDRPGDKRLVGYYVPRNGALRSADLKAHLKRIPPRYMVPSVLVRLDALPLTPSGKVDRQALPAPRGEVADSDGRHGGPRNAVEEALCAIWADVLGVAGVGIHDDFFDLGGHSLLATQAVARASRALNVDIRLSTLFDAPTVAEFAARVPAPAAGVPDAAGAGVPRLGRPGPGGAPLSFAQQRLWFAAQVADDPGAYNMPYVVRLRGPLAVEALRRALETVVHRHEPLRTTIRLGSDGAPRQIVRAPEPVELPVVSLDATGLDDPEAEVERRSAEEAERPFELSADLPLRASLLRLGARNHVLLLTMHHIAADGWSVAVLWRELSALYEAFSGGEAPSLPSLPVRYADFAAWQRDRLRGDRLEELLAYWRRALDGAPPALNLPTDRPGPAERRPRGGHRVATLSPDLTRRLRAFGREERATLFMVLLGGFQVVLQRWSGQDDFVLGVPVGGRPRPDLENLIGLFINPLSVRARLEGDPTLRELLRRVREATVGAYSHQDLPFEMLVEELRPDRSPLRSPLFQVVFNGVGVDDLSWPGGSVTAEISSSYARSKYDLTMYVRERGSETELKLAYDADLFSLRQMECLLDQYVHVLAQIAEAPDACIGAYSLATPASRRVLPNPRRPLARPRYAPVTDAFSRWAERRPGRPAVVQGGRVWTYRDLRDAGERIADALVAAGIAPGDRVAVSGTSSVGVVASMVGVLRCGGVLVPVDEKLPEQRRRTMIREAGPRVAIRVAGPDADGDPALSGIPTLSVDPGTAAVRTAPDAAAKRAERRNPSPEGPAYIFFTSGTTGVPKGILGSHQGLSHFLAWQRETYRIDGRDRVAQLTGLSFDVVLRDVFLPLTSGAAICLPPENVEETGAVWRWLHESGVTVLHVVPSRARTWLQTAPEGLTLPRLRLTFFAGEFLPRDLAAEWNRRSGGAGLVVNLYGPTETTLVKSAYQVPDEPGPGDAVLPVGRPLPQTQVLVLTRGGAPAGLCEIGEIAIRTPYRTLGYINPNGDDPPRFVPNPFRDDPDDLVYFTGDLGRYRPDGQLEIVGRADDQVKILGLRIEPAEIAAALGEHPGVGACHVRAVAEDGEPCLVAYVTPAGADRASPAELRRFLAQRLPAAMVPRYFVALDRLPLTPNGKVDRAALPVPATGRRTEDRVYTAPRNPVEERLAEIWRNALGVPRVGVHDDFFELGGHSLLAAMIVTQAAAALGVEIRIRTLFEAPTVAEFAAVLSGGSGPPPAASPPRRAGPGAGVAPSEYAPVSFGQERLWLLEQLEGEHAVYNMAFGWRLRGELDVTCLREALEAVVRRHEPLRTIYVTRKGIPFQVVRRPPRFELPCVDLGHLDAACRDAEIARRFREEAERPFDLGADLMVRATLLKLGRDDHVLLLTMHHIASDGWSFAVLWRELKELYRAAQQGDRAALPDLPVRYVDHAVWQREELSGERLRRLLEYWRSRLEGLAPLELPGDRPRRARPTYHGSRHDFVLDAGLVEKLKVLSRAEGATLNMTLLAAFQVVLGREAQREDVAVGMPIAGRDRPELAHHIGFFVNTLVIRTDLSASPSFRVLLRRVRQASLDAYDHRELPFEKLVAALRPARHRGRNPLVQVVFQLHEGWSRDVGLEGIEVSPVTKPVYRARFDVEMHLRPEGAGLRGTVLYADDLFEAGRIERLTARFRALLEDVAADPAHPIPIRAGARRAPEVERRRTDTYVPPRTPAERALARIWRDALRVPRVGLHDDFFELGGHSLLVADVAARMKDVLGRDVPLHTLFEHPTIAGVLAAVGGRAATGHAPSSPLVPIRKGSMEPPLILVHAAGGIVSPYVPLADRLDPHESLSGIEHPGLHGFPAPRSVPDLAARYADIVRAAQPEGPYLLGGWSFGGLVAYEAAQRIVASGGRVLLLALLDSFVSAGDLAERDPVATLRSYLRQYGLGDEAAALAAAEPGVPMEEALARLHRQLWRRRLLSPGIDLRMFRQHFDFYSQAVDAARDYVPSAGYPGTITVFRSSSRVKGASCAEGWARLHSGDLAVHDVPGDHYAMLTEPCVGTLATALQSLLTRVRSGAATGV